MVEPVCANILFCDLVIAEANTGKLSFIGTCSGLAHFQFPLVVPKLFLVATIGNIHPKETINVTFNIRMANSGVVIASGTMGLKRHPSATPPYGVDLFDVMLPFERLSFPIPEKYQVVVLVDGEEVGTRYLPVIATPRPTQQPPLPNT